MSTDQHVETVLTIGQCLDAGGDVLRVRPGGVEQPLLAGAGLHTGDKILTSDNATASLKFSDGTLIGVSGDSVLVIDGFAYENDTGDDGAYFTLAIGVCVIEAGDLAVGADDFIVASGDSTFSLRGARIAVRADPLAYDMVTLLPSRRGPLGEVLVQNKIGVQLLNRAFQTVRLGGAETDIPAPLTLPSGVLRDTYAGPGMAEALFPTDAADDAEDLSEQFQPFRALQDRLLERQFIARQVFPSDGPMKSGKGDAFLEDAFEGTRFRLAEPDPETSG